MMNEGKLIVKKLGAEHKFKWIQSYLELVLAVSGKKAGSFLKILNLKHQINFKFNPKF